jgi:ABC-type branched-subunit amino acid transport system ATPase component/ABC-type branched-subunit amino acid transport system permease subunit
VSSAVVVLARFRSLPVSFAGGLVLGAVVNLIAGYAREVDSIADILNRVPGLASSTVYLLLFFGLYFMGHQRGRTAGISVDEPRPDDHMNDLPGWRRVLPWSIAGAALVIWTFGVVPIGMFQAGPVERTLVASGLAISFVYLSFTVVTGLGGMVSLAQATFTTAGALTAGYVAHHGVLGGSFLAAVLLGALVAMVLGALVAVPAMRLGGVALALATLALAFIGETILFRLDSVNNNSRGWILSRPELGPFDFNDDRSFIALLIVMLGVAIWVVRNLEHSLTGRTMFATRNSAAAASVGISTAHAKVRIFAISALLAGLGGGLMSYGDQAATDSKYPATVGLLWLTIAVTWGVRRRAAAVLAGLVGVLLPRVIKTGIWIVPGTDTVHIPAILFGLGAINLARNPDGILSVVAMDNRARRNRRERARGGATEPGASEHATTTPAVAAHGSAADAATATTARGDAGALVVSGVRAGYGDVEVLHGIDLVVPAGSIVALVGANGAGKSTLCGAIAGSLAATAGTVWFNGADVTGLRPDERAKAGLVLSPESRGVFPALTVEDNLSLWLPMAADIDRVLDRFAMLAARRRVPAGNLSGGEQQILSLAPLLIRPPRVLVIDEPTLGLAPLVVDNLASLIAELRDEGTTLLLVEEKMRAVEAMADHLAFIRLGRITWFGPVGELDHAAIGEYYLGTSDQAADEVTEPA